MIWGLYFILTVFFPIIAWLLYEIHKKMDNILNLMQGKPIEHKENKKKKEQD